MLPSFADVLVPKLGPLGAEFVVIAMHSSFLEHFDGYAARFKASDGRQFCSVVIRDGVALDDWPRRKVRISATITIYRSLRKPPHTR